MRPFILSLTLLSTTLFSSCIKSNTGEQFNPTRPGYFLFFHTHAILMTELDDIWPIFAFALYYAAESDKEREQIHYTYFYSMRITHTDDVWRIISTDSELVIDTGGQSLYDDGATWTFYCSKHGYYASDLSSVSRNGNEAVGRYTLHLAQTPKSKNYICGEFTLNVTKSFLPAEYRHSIGISFEGTGQCHADNMMITMQISSPLRYSSYGPEIDNGEMILTTTNNGVTDTTTAIYYTKEVNIEYNGHNQIWRIGPWI